MTRMITTSFLLALFAIGQSVAQEQPGSSAQAEGEADASARAELRQPSNAGGANEDGSSGDSDSLTDNQGEAQRRAANGEADQAQGRTEQGLATANEQANQMEQRVDRQRDAVNEEADRAEARGERRIDDAEARIERSTDEAQARASDAQSRVEGTASSAQSNAHGATERSDNRQAQDRVREGRSMIDRSDRGGVSVGAEARGSASGRINLR